MAALLGDAAREVRAEAAEAVGRIALFGLRERLCGLLDDECWWVHFRAATAQSLLGEHGVDELKRLSRSGSDLSGRMAALVLDERSAA